MPITITVDEETGIAVGTGSGELNLSEMKAAARDLWNTRGFGGKCVLWDMRHSRFNASPEEVRELAEFARTGSRLEPGARMAFVASGDLEFGLIRMFEVFREDERTETNVFRDVEEAWSWLRAAADCT